MSKNKKIITVLLHLLAWIMVLAVPIGSVFYDSTPSNNVIWFTIIMVAVLMGCFYINYYVLLPKFLFKKKFIAYFGIIILLTSGIILLNNSFHKNYRISEIESELTITKRQGPPKLDPKDKRPPRSEDANNNGRPHPENGNPPPRPRHEPPHPANDAPERPNDNPKLAPFVFSPMFIPGAMLLFLVFGIAIRTTVRWFDEDKKNKEISEEQLKTELAFLKNQISPHFFFNTLNNIYALTESNPEQAKEITYKLSKLMRYLLYESNNSRNVSLEMEISFLNNYIDLIKSRLTDSISVITEFEQEKTKVLVPPLLFITFVENAFKHGISLNSDSFVDIKLKYHANRIKFQISNSIPQAENHEKGKGGLGLTNIKRRLELLYEENVYSLKIEQKEETYFVELIIPANEN